MNQSDIIRYINRLLHLCLSFVDLNSNSVISVNTLLIAVICTTGCGEKIFPFSETLRQVVRPIQSQRQRQAGDASYEVRLLLCKADNHPHIMARVRMSEAVTLLLLYASTVCKGTILPSLFPDSFPYICLIFLTCYISLFFRGLSCMIPEVPLLPNSFIESQLYLYLSLFGIWN